MDLTEEKRVTVVATGAALGADIRGVDLMQPLTDAGFRAIEAAWHQHLVLRFRSQRLDDSGLLAFARRFGDLDPVPGVAAAARTVPGPQPPGLA